MGTPFKMKGSPMARNFGSTFKQDTGFSKVPSTIQKGSKKTSYSEAYKNADKKKYPTLESFINAAKKYNKSNPKKSKKSGFDFPNPTIKGTGETDKGFHKTSF
jgi:hypothetical protein